MIKVAGTVKGFNDRTAERSSRMRALSSVDVAGTEHRKASKGGKGASSSAQGHVLSAVDAGSLVR